MKALENRVGTVKTNRRFHRLGQRLHAVLLRRCLRFLSSSPLEINEKSVLVVAPHQDDETLGCGGLIALKRAAGVPVQVAFLTDGSAAQDPASGLTVDAFVNLRKREACESLALLGVPEWAVHFFDLADQRLGTTAQGDLAIARLSELLKTYRPGEVFSPHRNDRHLDHEAAWKITCAAIRNAGINVDLFQYSIWMMWSAPLFLRLTPGQLAGATCLCIKSVRAQKRRAVEAYHSQCATLPKGFLSQFLGSHEIFFRTGPP